MKKLSLCMILLLMHFQGNKGKYYTIQKSSIFLTGFSSLFIVGLIRQLNVQSWSNSKTFLIWLIIWVPLFIAHYMWFLKIQWKGCYIHYSEFRKYLFGLLILVILSILIHLPY